MTHGRQSDLRSDKDRRIDRSSPFAVEPQRFADVHAVGDELRLVASGGRWIQSDTVVEVRA